jgi:hypothetical protein
MAAHNWKARLADNGQCPKCVRLSPARGLLLRFCAEEFVKVVSKIAQGTTNESPHLAIHFIDVLSLFWQSNPARLDSLPYKMVHLRWAKEFLQLP